MVNGIPYAFERIRLRVPAGLVVTMSDIDYDGKKEKKVQTSVPGAPRGVTRGPFEGVFNAKVSLFEFNLLNESVSDTGILGAPPMPVTVMYGVGTEEPTTDELEIEIESFKKMGKTGTDEIMVELKGPQTKIPILDGVPAYVVPTE